MTTPTTADKHNSVDEAFEQRLADAFDHALAERAADDDTVVRIMARIRRRQQLRSALALAAMSIGVVILVLSGLPLVAGAAAAVASLEAGNWASQLPAILSGAVVVFGAAAFFHVLIADDV